MHRYPKKAYFKMQNVLVDDRRIWVDLYVQFLIQASLQSLTLLGSSQSVARLNKGWSNNPIREGRGGRRDIKGPGGGGFGGRDDLEATRRYRDDARDENPSYGMVFDHRGDSGSSRKHRDRDERGPRKRSRSRSPRERRERRRSYSRDADRRMRAPTNSDRDRDRFRDRRR